MSLVNFCIRSIENRVKNLDDLLLCLQAQTNWNFEITIALNQDTKKILNEIIQNYGVDFKAKIKTIICPLNRTTRIKKLIENSSAEYTVFLDDDDHILDNYVQIINDNKYNNLIVTKTVSREYYYPNSYSRTKVEWNYDTEVLYEFFENNWPFGSVVFPTNILKKINLNENIEALEDWDCIQKSLLINPDVNFINYFSLIYNRRKDHKKYLDMLEISRKMNFSNEIIMSRIKQYSKLISTNNFIIQSINTINLLIKRNNEIGKIAHERGLEIVKLNQIIEDTTNQKLYRILIVLRKILNILRGKNNED